MKCSDDYLFFFQAEDGIRDIGVTGVQTCALPILGIKGSPTGSPVLEDVRVPSENAIGSVGKGMNVALGTLDHSRLGVAAQAVGIAQGATDHAVAYANERKQFGQAIAEFQGIQFKLADMETRTAAARELLYRASSKADRHEPDAGKYSAMAKLFASDTAMAVTVDAVQVLGGYGYVTEYPVERYMRDAKITQIYEGTNEIQRLVISRAMKRSEEHTSELQSRQYLVCRLLLEKKQRCLDLGRPGARTSSGRRR